MLDAAPRLGKPELFARLADGHAARTTVVTPNRRLAQTLAREFDQRQLAHGRTTWETADILPYSAFVQRLYEEACYSPLAGELPLLLTADQEQALWEEIVRHSAADGALLAVTETAALAREAWQLAHEWNLLGELGGPRLDDDAAAFAAWAREYADRTDRQRLTDAARLPEIVTQKFGDSRAKAPKLVVAYGFDIAAPRERAFFGALGERGVAIARCGPAPRDSNARRVAAVDARDEDHRAACWARARLEGNPDARIGIVVPDLGQRKRALRRALSQILTPGGAPSGAPFNISLGEPLSAYPLVAQALAALALGGREIEWERASVVIRSPFIAGGEAEREQRAQLDAKLRRRAERFTTLDRLVRTTDGAIARTLAAYADFKRNRLFGAQSPGEWARAFNDALAALGFPGDRPLDSTEYQTLKKWHELLARFAGLESVAPRIGFDQALARLQRMAAATLFQPETSAAPIQVLGVLEAAGMEFDHLWVMSLSDHVWPMPSRPNPFIPLRAQRDARVPHASPAAMLDFAKRLTADWLSCTGEAVLSHPRREKERDLAPSPLIAHFAEHELPLPAYDNWRAAIRHARKMERISDVHAPALVARDAMHGGASLIKDQAACAFRGFAIHRLRAKGIDAPHTGLDEGERGKLAHAVMAKVWGALKSKRVLDAMSQGELGTLLDEAAGAAIAEEVRSRPSTLAGRFAEIERARLVQLAREWLEYERRRDDFTIVAFEERRPVELGSLKLNVRLDRVDKVASGARIVIDYKTGKPTTLRSLCGPRPDEPQLPLYVTACEPDAVAAAFAQLRAGKMKFVGLAREENLLPGVNTPADADKRSGAAASWPDQVAFWRAELDRLAHEFAAGNAEVAPKDNATCRGCDLHPLCRIHERRTEDSEDDE